MSDVATGVMLENPPQKQDRLLPNTPEEFIAEAERQGLFLSEVIDRMIGYSKKVALIHNIKLGDFQTEKTKTPVQIAEEWFDTALFSNNTKDLAPLTGKGLDQNPARWIETFLFAPELFYNSEGRHVDFVGYIHDYYRDLISSGVDISFTRIPYQEAKKQFDFLGDIVKYPEFNNPSKMKDGMVPILTININGKVKQIPIIIEPNISSKENLYASYRCDYPSDGVGTVGDHIIFFGDIRRGEFQKFAATLVHEIDHAIYAHMRISQYVPVNNGAEHSPEAQDALQLLESATGGDSNVKGVGMSKKIMRTRKVRLARLDMFLKDRSCRPFLYEGLAKRAEYFFLRTQAHFHHEKQQIIANINEYANLIIFNDKSIDRLHPHMGLYACGDIIVSLAMRKGTMKDLYMTERVHQEFFSDPSFIKALLKRLLDDQISSREEAKENLLFELTWQEKAILIMGSDEYNISKQKIIQRVQAFSDEQVNARLIELKNGIRLSELEKYKNIQSISPRSQLYILELDFGELKDIFEKEWDSLFQDMPDAQKWEE